MKVKCLLVKDKILDRKLRTGILDGSQIKVKIGFRKHKNFTIASEPSIISGRKLGLPVTYPIYVCDVNDGKTIKFKYGKVFKVDVDNQVNYLSERKHWEAREEKQKFNKWETLLIMFAGLGFFIFILLIIKSITKIPYIL